MFGIGKNKEGNEVKEELTKEENVDAKSSDNAVIETEQNAPPPLTWKEDKALKKSCYETEIAHNDKFKKAYVIKNKRTGQVVELRAASPLHASKIIGWKSKQVRLIGTVDINNESDNPKTVGISSEVEIDVVEKK